MRNSKIKNAYDVARWRLCVGCGACAFVCPKKNITLHDIPGDGIRPRISVDRCTECGDCLRACPGIDDVHRSSDCGDEHLGELRKEWGPILEVWEGYASDPELRFDGSSGGAASAIALYCLEHKGMRGVLHISADEKKPCTNRTVLSRSREELLSRAGSRYSPASPCDGLNMIESATGPCAFIGKPCDVTAVRKAQMVKPEFNRNMGIAIGIFCAGTPSTQGTLDLLNALGIDPNSVEGLRYRGKGWPGKFSVKLKGEEQPREVLAYMDAWGFVQKYRPYRCYLCPDGTSEFADLSCGDPWYRQIKEREQGYSLVLVRTERGRQILYGAMRDGYVTLERADPRILEASQMNLLRKRRSIWGRLLTMKILGIPAPRLKGFYLFENWLTLPLKEKARSILGTARRIIQRKYYKPISTFR
ncbi:MAG TPA: Coenzyme F420 hydrogenase/dehydrogenase, beta subunit C-terminal domain [Nitrospirota bacterium]|nr:Coenzyme F420 hydrogenase/dehydrogenase, beta subunit C-terminal domain [Nitrospirota bacterium]